MTPAAMLDLLQRWRAAGRLRALDVALARFVHGMDASAPASLLLATALLAQLEGRGHSCLPLDAVARDAAGLLAWSADAPDADDVTPVRETAASASASASASAVPDLTTALSDWPPNAAAARAAWGRQRAVSTGAAGTTPLVLAGNRLYLRRYWHYESQVARAVLARTLPGAAAADGAGPDGVQALDHDHLRGIFRSVFAPAAVSTAAAAAAADTADAAIPGVPQTAPGPDWQQVACAIALRGRLTLITGGPGTGKTHTAAKLLQLVHAVHAVHARHAVHASPQALRVALAAPTGKAAARLRQSMAAVLQQQGPALAAAPVLLPPGTTLHALLGTRPGTRRFRHDAANPLAVDLLFVDEASMVHLEMMAALLAALPPHARLVLLGDKDQLASVEAGAVLGDLCQPGPGGYSADTAQWVQAVSGQRVPVSSSAGGWTGSAGTDGTDGTEERAGHVPPAGAVALAQQTVMLRHSHRFAGPIGRLSVAVNRGDGDAALALLRAGTDFRAPAQAGQADAADAIALHETGDPGAIVMAAIDGRPLAGGGHGCGYRAYLELLSQRPAAAAAFDAWARSVLQEFDRCRVLCAVRDGPFGVAGINAAIERAASARGLVLRRGEWYVGRPVIVTRNDPALGVFNGDIGIVLQAPAAAGFGTGGARNAGAAASLRAYFPDGAGLRSVAVGRLADAETAFAMTVHKSQGSEFEHVVLVLPDHDAPVLTRELLYTGITRARQVLTLIASDAARVRTASARLTQRVSGLVALLQDGAAMESSRLETGRPHQPGVAAA